jgi:hypothetical protein
MSLKRYLLTSGDSYYPTAGAHDFIETFDTIEEAKDKIISMNRASGKWVAIIDMTNLSEVFFKFYRDD